jgi:archaellum component FlaC
MATKYNVENVRTNLPADQLSGLQTEISSALDKLKDLQPEIKKIAQEKALKPEEKDEVLKNYGTMYEEYNKVATELQEVMEDVEKARK